MIASEKPKLGEILVNEGVVSHEQIERALGRQDAKNKKLGKVLIDMGLATEEKIAAAICGQLGLDFQPLKDNVPPQSVTDLLDKNFAIKNLIVPLRKENSALVVAVSDPLNIKVLDEAAHATGLRIKPVVSTETDILDCIGRTYKIDETIQRMLKAFDFKDNVHFVALPQDEEVDVQKRYSVSGATPIMKMLAFIFMDALKQNASDIYIESMEKEVRMRYRIDGDLVNVIGIPGTLKETLISHIKKVANLDVCNKKTPQEGRSVVLLDGRAVELEVSTLPTLHGDRVNIRLCNKDKPARSFKELGIPDESAARLLELASSGHGMLLFTGSKNSGKKATMYALLQALKEDSRDILSLEHRVESKLVGITQTVIPDHRAAFELGNVLRQRPDVLMVDELTDREEARAALQAAYSGALVISSVSANNPAEAVFKLINLGIGPHKLASALFGLVTQATLRSICPKCREQYTPDLGPIAGLELSDKPEAYYRGKGCPSCHGSGYKGRSFIMEITRVGQRSKRAMILGAEEDALLSALRPHEHGTLVDYAWGKVCTETTTVEEALAKVSPEYWVKPEKEKDVKYVKSAVEYGRPLRPNAVQREIPPDADEGGPWPETVAPESGKTPGSPVEDGVPERYKVLLAMAEGRELERVKDVLLKNDFEIAVSNTGSDALDMIYAVNPHILIYETELPSIGVLAAYKRIYDSQRHYVPVISVIKNYKKDYSDLEKKMRSDVKAYSPMDLNTLLENLSELVNEIGKKRDWKVV